MSNKIQKKIYAGEVMQSVKVLGVTLHADAETVARYNASLTHTKEAFARLRNVAWRLRRTPDEKNIIDQ